MEILKKEAFWSLLEIKTNSKISDEIIKEINIIVESFENKYSRFKKGNYLYNLNKSWKGIIDEEFSILFEFCKMLNEVSEWYFDITVASLLENLWYWIEKGSLNKEVWCKNIKIEGNDISLNNTTIEFWAIWKWYIIDRIYDILKDEYDDLIIDFWGDIMVWNIEKTIWLEDPYDSSKILWKIQLKNMSFASSSWQKRIFSGSHHLINPKDKKSQNDKIAIYLNHKQSIFADWFSTALFVTPIENALKILNNIPWLEWLIISKEGEIYKSSGFDVEMY